MAACRSRGRSDINRLRYEFGSFIQEGRFHERFKPSMTPGADLPAAIAEKDKIIDELEETFETKYLRYCDPLIPLHFLAQLMARTIIVTLRIV